MAAPKISKGDKLVKFYGEPHDVGCSAHRGTQPIAFEERIDPETNKPRVEQPSYFETEAGPVLANPDTVGSVSQFPVYGDDVGYDPDCAGCRMAAAATRQHAEAKRLDREQAEAEYQERLRDPEFAEQVRGWLEGGA